MSSVDQWRTEKQVAIQAAQQAGKVLLDWAGRFTVRSKGVNDLVTEADHAAQKLIHQKLAFHFPGDDFLEEEGERQTEFLSSRRWIIDPLDGTTNYVHGLPLYCVSIALEADGELVVGVIHDPNRNECFAAAKGLGATCNGRMIQVSGASRLTDSLLCVGLPADLGNAPGAADAFARMSARSRSVRRLGTAALAMAYVAAGRLDGYWAANLHPWDAAAGVILIREAGGQVTNFTGNPYDLYTPDIVVSNGLIHPPLVAGIAS